jgi:hypothetical protein
MSQFNPLGSGEPLKIHLGDARMCSIALGKLRLGEQADQQAYPQLQEFLKERAYGQFGILLNEEIPPDRVVFYDRAGEVLAVVMLE